MSGDAGYKAWNSAQQAAIQLDGQLLVSASAGTGKTAVLVERIIQRVLEGSPPAALDRFLVVTFNDAAAAQMRARILAALLERRAAQAGADLQHVDEQIALLPRAHISTLHSWCLRLVRQHFHTLGLDPAVTPMDEHEADLLLREVLDRLCEERYERDDQGWLKLVDAYGSDRGDEPVRELALDLLRFARTQPDPRVWLVERLAELKVAQHDDFANSAWGAELLELAVSHLNLAARHLQDAIVACGLPDGPSGYIRVLAGDLADVEGLVARLRGPADGPREASARWTKLLQGLAELHKARLSGYRGESDELRKLAQSNRNKAWDLLGALRQAATSWSPERLAADLDRAVPLVDALVQLALDLDQGARAARTASGRIDFADFEYYTLKLLTGPVPASDCAPRPSALALTLQGRYLGVLVDEFQDINPAQEQILRMVSCGNLFCVGDIKQSIYRFRGTDPGAFRKLRQTYHPVDPEDAQANGYQPASPGSVGQAVDLSANFRSRPTVLAAVNFLCRQLMHQDLAEVAYDAAAELKPGAAQLYSTAPDADGPVEFYLLERATRTATVEAATDDGDDADDSPPDDEQASPDGDPGERDPDQDLDTLEREAAVVGRRILRMVGSGPGTAEFCVYDTQARSNRPVRFGDIAVLMRAVQGRANRYLEVLSRLGIPVRAQLSTGYFSAIEVETVLALLRVIDNPRQDIDLAAVLRSPLVGLDEGQLAEVRSALPRGPYHDAVHASAAGDNELAARLRWFLERLETWRTAARRGPLGDLVWLLLQETGYLAFVAGLPDGLQRQANLFALHDRARQFDGFARQGLGRFLRFIERLHEAKRDLGAVSDPGQDLDAVLVTTIHKAKGLEFPVVFLPDLGKAFHPSSRSDLLWHSGLGFGPKVADRELGIKYPTAAWQALDRRLAAETLAEELRVLYVGLTRARERLVLSGSVPNVAAALARWQATAGGAQVPPEILATRRSYLDWVGTALTRHAGVSRALGLDRTVGSGTGANTDDDPPDWRDPSKWSVQVLGIAAGANASPAGDGAQEPGLASSPLPSPSLPSRQMPVISGENPWSRVQQLATLGVVDEAALSQLDRRMSWRYPWVERTALPSKLSVSELRRRHVELIREDEDLPAPQWPGDPVEVVGTKPEASAAAAGFVLPTLHGWGETRIASGVQRGTLAHLLLRHMGLTGPLDRAGLAAQLAGLIRRRIVPAQAAQLGNDVLDGIAWFFTTATGQRVVEASAALRREQAFTMALPAKTIWPERAGLADEVVLVQGIIDYLIVGPQGLEIIEFKTDRLPADTAGQLAAHRYRRQVELYCQAARDAFQLPVHAAYLALLTPRVLIELDILDKSIGG